MSKRAKPDHLPLDAGFDSALADKLARLEIYNKHHYRPNTYLHKWWARRCGTTFRLLLKHLAPDPACQDYYASGGLRGRFILDPMMGGGTTVHEALRLGANVLGMDLDPIPITQTRATLVPVPLADLEAAFTDFLAALRRDQAHFYRTTCPHCRRETESWFVLYGACRSCACGEVLVVDSLLLRQETDGTQVRLCPRCRQVTSGAAACDCAAEPAVPVVEKSQSSCPDCGQAYAEDLERAFYRRYEPLAVAGHCPDDGLFWRSFDGLAAQCLEDAEALRRALPFQERDFLVEPGSKSIQLLRRGVHTYLDLFSTRQLLFLEQAIALLPRYDPAMRLNLGLLVSTSLEFNAMLCGYKGRGSRRAGAIRHTFAHHAYSFPYTALENNPLYPRKASGTLQQLFHARLRRARQWAARPRERDLNSSKARFVTVPGEVDQGQEVADPSELQEGTRRFLLRQASATCLALPDGSVDAVVTDPPYYDSVQYSDLSAFFRVWLRLLLPGAARWDFDVEDSAVDAPQNGGDGRYAALLAQIFSECRRVLRAPHGRLVFTFHHWNPRAWAALTAALTQAGFLLVNRYVVYSENPISVHIANMNSLTHDAILVLAPAGTVAEKAWARPRALDVTSSAQFCADCGALLGWMLTAALPPEEIERLWQEALPA